MTDNRQATSGWRWRGKLGALARNTVLGTAWQGVRLVLQFAYLVLVARVLGVEGYGVFAGSVALAGSLSPLVGLGFGMILVQEVSRTPGRFPEFWAKALRAVAVSGPVMTGVMLALALLLLPVDDHWTVILLIAAAELLAMPLVATSSLAFQAHERLGRTMFNHAQLNLLRLGEVAPLAVIEGGGLLGLRWGDRHNRATISESNSPGFRPSGLDAGCSRRPPAERTGVVAQRPDQDLRRAHR